MSQEPLTMAEDKYSFEEQLQRIEEIVTDLESGALSLEDMVARYESGMRLIADCQQRLATAELKVTQIAEETSLISPPADRRFGSEDE